MYRRLVMLDDDGSRAGARGSRSTQILPLVRWFAHIRCGVNVSPLRRLMIGWVTRDLRYAKHLKC